MSSAVPGLSSTSYRVVFFRNLVNDRGEPYRVSIDNIKIGRAHSRERALAAAQRRFARRHHVRAWNHLADGYEEHEERHPWGSHFEQGGQRL
jgi:hypothetical protein